MKFLKSFKLVFVLFCLFISNPLLGMEKSPGNELSQLVKTEKLVDLFMRLETSIPIHDGVVTDLGKGILRELFNKPPKSIEPLRLRQELLKKLVNMPDNEFDAIKKSILNMLIKVIEFINLDQKIQGGRAGLEDFNADRLNFKPEFQNPMILLFPLLFICAGLSSIYASSTGGMDFTKSLVISMLLGALWEYFLGILPQR